MVLCDDDKPALLTSPRLENDGESVQNKSHIAKVMFGAALARPRKNPVTGEWWDGKVHLHPFVEFKAEQHSSVHHPAGTIETKTITVNKEQSHRWIFEYVVAIAAQWPDWCP